MIAVIHSLALALAASALLAGADPVSTPPASGLRAGGFEPSGPNANYALVDVGAQAPDFSFDSQGRALRLHDLRTQGNVLLVFAPDDERLLALERERVRLLAIGVVPVAVLDQRASACSATARRLRLGYSLIPDPRRVIGEQFNTLDPQSRADAPAWFVLDRAGRVHDLERLAWPDRSWSEVTSRALGLADPANAAPASFGRN